MKCVMAHQRLRGSIMQFSSLVNEALNCIGYNKEQIQLRGSLYAKAAENMSKSLETVQEFNIIFWTAGSRAEGIPFNSDMDMLVLYQDVICVEEGHEETGLTVLETDMTDCPAGYTRLRIRHCDNDDSLNKLFTYSMTVVRRKGEEYVSSIKFLNIMCMCYSLIKSDQDGLTIVDKASNGPAVTTTINVTHPLFDKLFFMLESDVVPAFPAYVPSTLRAWAARQRFHDWPSPEVIADVASTEVILVPVSLKESRESTLEWRICFPKGEKELIRSMNEFQIKVYALLKMVKKELIGKVANGLTSYILKNAVFWVCEGMPSKLFTAESLVDRLKDVLHFIKQCMDNNFLPCFLIPERNLLLGKLEGHNRYRMIIVLRDLLDSNGSFLLQCNRLAEGMVFTYLHPAVAANAMLMRNKLELFLLYAHVQLTENWKTKMGKDGCMVAVYELISNPQYMEGVFSCMNILGFDGILSFLNPETSSFENFRKAVML